MALIDRLTAPGPKRILALDGGGIRGVITLGFLERIEAILRERHDNPDLRLYEYYDLIGGTSTGSIIATMLAVGMSVSEIKELYLNIGGTIFNKSALISSFGRALFDEKALEKELENMFGDITMGDERIKTGLCIVAKRADTGSTWPMINHPNSKYYKYNAPLLVRSIVRASAAAPVYFLPQELDIGGGVKGAFIDGGVSMANNPALQLFLIATLKGYHFNWEAGEDKLFITSIGTGSWNSLHNTEEVLDKTNLAEWGMTIPTLLMDDATWWNQLLLQSISKSPTPWRIDSEVGDLSEDLITPNPLLSYIRYEAILQDEEMYEVGLNDLRDKAEALRNMTAGENRFDLDKVGQAFGNKQVKADHFPKAFDLS